MTVRTMASVAVLAAAATYAGFLVSHGINSSRPSTAARTHKTRSASPSPAAQVGLSQGDIPPDFTLATTSGQKITLSSLRGHPVWLNFWATWCPWCKKEIPIIEQFKTRYGNRLDIYGVDVQQASPTVSAYMTQKKMNYPVLLDTTGQVSATYGVTGLPMSVFINAQGRIQAVYQGAFLDKATAAQYVQAVMGQG